MSWIGSSLWNFRFAGLNVNIEIWTIFLCLIFYVDALLYIRKQIQRFGLNDQFLKLAAIVGMIGVLFSLFAHELAHAAMAHLLGVGASQMTVTWWGAYVVLRNEVLNAPLKQTLIALAGPLANFLIAGFFALFVARFGESVPENTIQYISYISIRLGKFNLLPLFMLDGGKVVFGIASFLFGARLGLYVALFVTGIVIGLYLTRPKSEKQSIEDRLRKFRVWRP